jgi:hypothetical protein
VRSSALDAVVTAAGLLARQGWRTRIGRGGSLILSARSREHPGVKNGLGIRVLVSPPRDFPSNHPGVGEIFIRSESLEKFDAREVHSGIYSFLENQLPLDLLSRVMAFATQSYLALGHFVSPPAG